MSHTDADVGAQLARFEALRTRLPDLLGARVLVVGAGPFSLGLALLCAAHGAEVVLALPRALAWNSETHPAFLRTLLKRLRAFEAEVDPTPVVELLASQGAAGITIRVVGDDYGGLSRAAQPGLGVVISDGAIQGDRFELRFAGALAHLTADGGLNLHRQLGGSSERVEELLARAGFEDLSRADGWLSARRRVARAPFLLDEDPPQRLAPTLARYAFAAQLGASGRVLDVACGSGVGARVLAAAGLAVDGLAFNPDGLAMAQVRGTPEGERIEYRLGEANGPLPYAVDRFAGVVCLSPVDRKRLDEIDRVLGKQGWALIVLDGELDLSERFDSVQPLWQGDASSALVATGPVAGPIPGAISSRVEWADGPARARLVLARRGAAAAPSAAAVAYEDRAQTLGAARARVAELERDLAGARREAFALRNQFRWSLLGYPAGDTGPASFFVPDLVEWLASDLKRVTGRALHVGVAGLSALRRKARGKD